MPADHMPEVVGLCPDPACTKEFYMPHMDDLTAMNAPGETLEEVSAAYGATPRPLPEGTVDA